MIRLDSKKIVGLFYCLMSRPEASGPADLFYNQFEVDKYTQNTRIMYIQRQMAERALQLLALPPDQPCLILDVGCGSGISGQVLAEAGHEHVGVDISPAMLRINDDPHIVEQDVGDGLTFTHGLFDGCISVSALQWLCYSNKRSENPRARLIRFFQSLYSCLCHGARAALQIYPENNDQISLMQDCAIKAGFTGGLIVDYPNSTMAKKFYLLLFSGHRPEHLPAALDGDAPAEDAETREQIRYSKTRQMSSAEKRRAGGFLKGKKWQQPVKFSREWKLHQVVKARLDGKDAKPVSRYSGRHRRNHGLF